jgi:predicted double-glycine peptidase
MQQESFLLQRKEGTISLYGLQELERAINNDLPVIVKCIMHEAGKPWNHYAVVTGINKENLHINDPYWGQMRLDKSKFRSKKSKYFWGKQERARRGMVMLYPVC